MFAVHPRESVSQDSQVATLPYESCSLATPQSGGTTTRAYFSATYKRNAIRSFVLPPLAGEVPRSGQGGALFPARRAVCLFSHGRSPVVKVLSKLAPNYFQRAPTAILSEATQPFYTTLGTEGRQARWMTYAPLRRRRRPLREYSPSRHFPIFPPIYSISHPYTLQTAQICRNSYFSPIFSNFLFFSLFSLLTYGSHGSYNTSRNKQGGFS